MYVREVEDQKLIFAVSGLLWHRSLVMIDTNTRSLWSHIYGKAMHGPLKDTKLKPLPSTMTDWKTWRETHPRTSVVMMSRTAKEFNNNFFQDLGKFVVGWSVGEKARAWPFDVLLHESAVNDTFADQAVLITFDAQTKAALLFNREVDGQKLSFAQRKDKLVDEQTGTVWDSGTGLATEGKLLGKQLKPIAATVSFRDAWERFYPGSEYYEGVPR